MNSAYSFLYASSLLVLKAMIMRSFIILIFGLFFSLHQFAISSYAEDQLPSRVHTNKPAPIDELKLGIIKRDQIISELLRRMDELEKRVEELDDIEESTPKNLQTKKPHEKNPSKQAGLQKEEDSVEVPQLSNEERIEQERLIRAAFERTLIERGGLLLPPYRMEFEPSLSYVHSSVDRIVIDGFTIENTVTIGDIFSERVRKDAWSFSSSLRMGLPWDSQIEATIPYLYQSRNVLTADNEERTDDVHGIGDMQISLSHQFLRARGWLPDILGSLRWKTKTGSDPFRNGAEDELSLGTGFNSLQASFTAVKVSDPVVFIGGFSYTETFKEKKGIGLVNPGNTFGLQLGMAMALNLDTSINFGLDLYKTKRTTLNNVDVPGSSLTTGTFSLGLSHVMSEDISLDVGIGLGLTEDSPDFQVNFSLPVRFSVLAE
jgi:hypothetical protein